MEVVSYRRGTINCNTGTYSCMHTDFTLINREKATGTGSTVYCERDVCGNQVYYCDDPSVCTYECRQSTGCSWGTYDWFCKDKSGATCEIESNSAFAWVNTGSRSAPDSTDTPYARIYCNTPNDGDDCNDPMPSAAPSSFIDWEYAGDLPATLDPTETPSVQPSYQPSSDPSRTPTYEPSSEPSPVPTMAPSLTPTGSPSQPPTDAPSPVPTLTPTGSPVQPPTGSPSQPPTLQPTDAPTAVPSNSPSQPPTRVPSDAPSYSPTSAPSLAPSDAPSFSPTSQPTEPSMSPTNAPTDMPTPATPGPSPGPTSAPSIAPTASPTPPSAAPTEAPSHAPVQAPTNAPSSAPTQVPSEAPTNNPSYSPSNAPTQVPSDAPSDAPTQVPSSAPTEAPSGAPSNSPSSAPTRVPSGAPSTAPTIAPTVAPSRVPSGSPTQPPTDAPSLAPTRVPSGAPTAAPTFAPTITCVSLNIFVDLEAANLTSRFDDVWSGLYEESDQISFGRPIWYQVNEDENDNSLEYISGAWLLKGTDENGDDDYLSFRSNAKFPPEGIEAWEHIDLHTEEDDVFVTLDCSDSFSPTNAPSDAPTTRPTFSPTDNCPFIEVRRLGTGSYITNDTFGLTMELETNSTFDIGTNSWILEDIGNTLNDRDIWELDLLEDPLEIYIQAFYNGEDWTLRIDDGEIVLFQIYADPFIFHDGKHPPFGTEDWIRYNSNGTVLAEEYLFNCIETNFPTGAPTVAPVQPPTDAPSVIPSSAPTEAPVLAPSNAPTTSPTGTPLADPTSAPSSAPTSPTLIPTNSPTSECELLNIFIISIDDPDNELSSSTLDESDLIESIEGGYVQESSSLFLHSWWKRQSLSPDNTLVEQRLYWQNNEWILTTYYDTLKISDDNGLYQDQPPPQGYWSSELFNNLLHNINCSLCTVSTFAPSNEPSLLPSGIPTLFPTDPTAEPSINPTSLPTELPTLKPTNDQDTVIAGDGDEAAFGLSWFYLVLILFFVLLCALVICVLFIKKVNKDAAEGRLVSHTDRTRQSRGQSARNVDGQQPNDRMSMAPVVSSANSGYGDGQGGGNNSTVATGKNLTSQSPSSVGAAAMIAAVPKSPKSPRSPRGKKGNDNQQEIEMLEQQRRDRANTNFVEEEEDEPAPPVVSGLSPPNNPVPQGSGSFDKALTDTLATEMASEDDVFANALANAHRRATVSPDEHDQPAAEKNPFDEDDGLDL